MEKRVKFDVIVKKILLPFFQIHSRILRKGQTFEIGTMQFVVAATAPHKQGKISVNTKMRCNT